MTLVLTPLLRIQKNNASIQVTFMHKTKHIHLFFLFVPVVLMFTLFWQKNTVVTHTDPLTYGIYAQSAIDHIQTAPSTTLDILYLKRNIRGTFHEPLFLLFYWPLQNFYLTLFVFGLFVALLFVTCLNHLLSQVMNCYWALLLTLFVFFTPNILMEFFYADTFIVTGTLLLLAYSGLLRRNSLSQFTALSVALCIRPLESLLVCAVLYFFHEQNRGLLKIQIASLVVAALWWLPFLPRYAEHVYSQMQQTLTFNSGVASNSIVETFLDSTQYYYHVGGMIFLFLGALVIWRSHFRKKWTLIFSFLLVQFFTIGNPQYILFTFFGCLMGMLYESPSLLRLKEKYIIIFLMLFQIVNGVICSTLKWNAPWGGLIVPATRSEEIKNFFTLIKKDKMPKNENIPIIGLCKTDHKSIHYFSTMLISEQVISKDYSYRLQPLPLQSLEGGFSTTAPYTLVVMPHSLFDPSMPSEAVITVPKTILNRWANKFFRIPNIQVALVKDLRTLQSQSYKCKSTPPNTYLINDDPDAPNTEIYDGDGHFIRSIPLSYVQFFKNGAFVGATREALIYTDPNGMSWSKSIDVTHDITLTSGENYIATIEEYGITSGDKRNYYERVLLLDRNGNTVFSWDAYEHMSEIESLLGRKIQPRKMPIKKNLKRFDYFHFNAVSEIPDDSYTHIHASFRKGNLLLSCWNPKIFIVLDRNTQRMLWLFDIKEKLKIEAPHTPLFEGNGVLSFYVNDFANAANPIHRSGILRWESSKDTMTKIESFGGQHLYTVDKGSVQKENNEYLILFAMNNTLIRTDLNGGILRKIHLDRSLAPHGKNPYYRVRIGSQKLIERYLENHAL